MGVVKGDSESVGYINEVTLAPSEPKENGSTVELLVKCGDGNEFARRLSRAAALQNPRETVMLKLLGNFSVGVVLALGSISHADSPLEAHIKAVGGAAALAKLETITRAGVARVEGDFGVLQMESEEIYDLQNRRGYSSQEATGYSQQIGWADRSGWKQTTQSGLTDLPAGEFELAKLSAGPSPLFTLQSSHKGVAIEFNGEREFGGKQCLALRTTGIDFYLNMETKLLEGLVLPAADVEITFEHYQEVSGIQFAHRITTKGKGFAITAEYEQTKVNAQINSAKFEKPSSAPAKTPADGVTAKGVIAQLDKDGDKRISKDEASSELKPYFQYIDTNSDGKIDLQEAQVMLRYTQQQPPKTPEPAELTEPETAASLVGSMDANGDGKIAKEEALEDLKLYFSKYDANRDGAIDLKEAQSLANYVNGRRGAPTARLPTATPGRVTAKQIIRGMDANQDGKITKREASAELKPNFQYIDTNGDGVIDVKEAENMAKYVNEQQSP